MHMHIRIPYAYAYRYPGTLVPGARICICIYVPRYLAHYGGRNLTNCTRYRGVCICIQLYSEHMHNCSRVQFVPGGTRYLGTICTRGYPGTALYLALWDSLGSECTRYRYWGRYRGVCVQSCLHTIVSGIRVPIPSTIFESTIVRFVYFCNFIHFRVAAVGTGTLYQVPSRYAYRYLGTTTGSG